MASFRRLTVLDIAIRVLGTILIGLLVYLGVNLYMDRTRVEQGTPASRAVRDLEQAVQADPQNVAARLRLAEALAAAGNLKDSGKQFEEALRLDPKNADARTGLGLIAMREKRYDDAEVIWRAVIKDLKTGEYASQDQRLESAYYYLATVLIEQEKYADSVGYLKEALRIRKEGSDTHYLLSVAYKGLKKTDKQREELEITLDLDPKMPEANYDLGQLMLAQGDQGGAAEHFRVSADSAQVNDLPLKALEALGDPESRIASARNALSKDPEQALEDARVALALAPNNVEAARLVGRAAVLTKDKARAKQAWQLVLDLVPKDREATKALEGLER